MTKLSILALRALLTVGMLGALLAQLWYFPTLSGQMVDMYPEVAWLRWPVLAAVVLVIAAVEVGIVSVWALLSMVERDSVFSPRAFRWVDLIITAAAVATALAIAVFAILAYAEASPGGLMLPLLALIVAGASFTLLMIVMKGLLRQAANLTVELGEVI
ncbi:MAG: DUF2975 domain-containing protein [Propionibacteriaceae bacterium]|nr:DUF2975 domain-containing protein [Propionibacteriaceae bacterium]